MDVKEIIREVINNYDHYTERILSDLRAINCHFSVGFKDLPDCILNRKCYACNVTVYHHTRKIVLPNVWLVMLGSKLDTTLRQLQDPTKVIENLASTNILDEPRTRDEADIAITCFLVNGMVKQIPYFVTNNSSHIHVVKNNIVRMYRYNEEEKGTELNYYMDNVDDIPRGSMRLRLSDGQLKSPTAENLQEFVKCPFLPKMEEVMQHVYVKNFNIDHLGNKIIISPGHLLYKLFRKSLWIDLIKFHKQDISLNALKCKARIVKDSVENGDFLHVLSKKTLFYKEHHAKFKMTSSNHEINREVSENNQVFIEKKSTCYRDVNFQCYQLIPYLSHMVNIQISQKVKTLHVLSFKDSYKGFFCLFGTVESKNIGRQMMLARNVHVSTNTVGDLYGQLDLAYDPKATRSFVVVNGACIPVCRSPDVNQLLHLKRTFCWIEAYNEVENGKLFTFINLNSGIPFKMLQNGVWVSPKDMAFYVQRFGSSIDFPFLTNWYIDLIPYYNHNAFPKNILTLNALKNAILATKPDYGMFFRETATAYNPVTPYHQVVLPPVDNFSEPWTISIPKLNVMFASFRGLTQEDCIVVHQKVRPFDCRKLYVLKFKLSKKGYKFFHPVDHRDTESEELGQLVCPQNKLVVTPQTMHATVETIRDDTCRLLTTKKDYRYKYHDLTAEYLFVTIEKSLTCSDGDKLCSLHGQKGVVVHSVDMPSVDTGLVPDLLLNPLGIISRQTMGQILEMSDNGRDYDVIFNPEMKRIRGKALIGKAFYFPINYMSQEHMYSAIDCNKDMITGQPVKGRSRQGGMRAGNMEIFNGFRGNGLAACYEEKLQDDLVVTGDVTFPKSVSLCTEDAKFFKTKFDFVKEPLISFMQ